LAKEVVAVAVNIALNLILVRYPAHGGLALATSLAALVGCLLLLYLLRRRLGHIGGWGLLRKVGKVTLAALVSGLAVFSANGSLSSFGCWASFEGFVLRCLGGGGLAVFVMLGLRLVLLFGLGAVVYALLCRALRVREMAYALNLLRRLKAYVAR
ncbi:MAG: Integral membrane protein MviN, partial [Thermoanaerobacterales bacterium 50_218]